MSENKAIGHWLLTVPKRCFFCGGKGDWRGLAVHHVQRRSSAPPDRRDWAENLSLACAPCHSGPLETMPHAEQLAHKWAFDRCCHASLASLVRRWLCVRDGDPPKAPNRVLAAEVEEHLPAALAIFQAASRMPS